MRWPWKRDGEAAPWTKGEYIESKAEGPQDGNRPPQPAFPPEQEEYNFNFRGWPLGAGKSQQSRQIYTAAHGPGGVLVCLPRTSDHEASTHRASSWTLRWVDRIANRTAIFYGDGAADNVVCGGCLVTKYALHARFVKRCVPGEGWVD